MLVRHYKGGLYHVLHHTIDLGDVAIKGLPDMTATHTETEEEVLIWRSYNADLGTHTAYTHGNFVIYTNEDGRRVWARPTGNFWGDAEHLVQRFRIVKDQNIKDGNRGY